MTDEKDMAKQLKYRAGDVVTLKVARLGEMGAFLDAGTGDTSDDILLHKLQQTEAVNVGDEVKVYLYKDPHGRLTASQKLPKMREGQIGYVKVLSVTKDAGFGGHVGSAAQLHVRGSCEGYVIGGCRKDTLSQAGKPLYGYSGGERISAGFAIGTVGVYRPGASRRLL